MSHSVFLVDDHPVMRQGYVRIINREVDLDVCGEAGSAEEAIEKLSEAQPDLLIADLFLEGTNGLEMIKRLLAIHPNLKVLVVSMLDELIYAERALRAGAQGYVMKEELDTGIIKAIRQVLDGRLYVSDSISQRILERRARSSEAGLSPVTQLTDRELDIFEQIGLGHSTRDIAEHLHISPKTVQTHRSRIMDKLNLENVSELTRYAVLWLERRRGTL